MTLHQTRVDHIREQLQRGEIALDPATYDRFKAGGWTRAELQAAIDALLEAGAATAQMEGPFIVVRTAAQEVAA